LTKRNYELMLVLSPELDETTLDALIDRIKRFLENAQAQVLSFKSWGLRRMAYVILGHREGRYYLVHFTSDSENTIELERNLTFTEGILRHLLTRAEHMPTQKTDLIDAGVVTAPVTEQTQTDQEENISTSETA
jgi:small subunit ribosomal protein S6